MITIGFSSHRAESLPFIVREMESHDVIVLEEPYSPLFEDMINERISVDDYIEEGDSEFPVFERLMCKSLCTLKKKGKKIIQIEPYLEKLMAIHELFLNGKQPGDVLDDMSLKYVYQAERAATGALIHYYKCSLSSSFEEVVESVKTFARLDAERFILRDRMRAESIVSLEHNRSDLYIEAGHIHYPLYRFLKGELDNNVDLRIEFVLSSYIQKRKGKRRNMGPGDILTLKYAFGQEPDKDTSDILAARSLIYIKLVEKDELIPDDTCEAPHCENEIQANRIVDLLSFDDCKNLYSLLRFSSEKKLWNIVKSYLNMC